MFFNYSYFSMLLMLDYVSYLLIFLNLMVFIFIMLSNLAMMNLYFFLLLMLMIFYLLNNIMLVHIINELFMLFFIFMINFDSYQFECINSSFFLLIYMMLFSLPFLIFHMMEKNFLMVSVYLLFLLNFMVKVSLFMFHFWLIKVHLEVSNSMSMLLSCILLKIGGYMLIHIINYINFLYGWNKFLIFMSFIGIFYVSIFNYKNLELKMIVANSSNIYMNIILLMILFMTDMMIFTGVLMILNHSFSSLLMFKMLDYNYNFNKSSSILLNKGMLLYSNNLIMMIFLMKMLNLSSTISLGFISEFFFFFKLLDTSKLILYFFMMIMFMNLLYNFFIFKLMVFYMDIFNYSVLEMEIFSIKIGLIGLLMMNSMFMKLKLFNNLKNFKFN